MATAVSPTKIETVSGVDGRQRFDRCSWESEVLADIYEEEVNICIWKRELSAPIKSAVSELLLAEPALQAAMVVAPESVKSSLEAKLPAVCRHGLGDNVAELVDMFCCLFDIKQAGLRLTALDRAMCPRFHVDRVPCRFVSTYQGIATEWLPHAVVDRARLGSGSQGRSDLESGLFQSPDQIRRLDSGDVALLKGELWEGNEHAGLVHRSPMLQPGERRLLLTLDFVG